MPEETLSDSFLSQLSRAQRARNVRHFLVGITLGGSAMCTGIGIQGCNAQQQANVPVIEQDVLTGIQAGCLVLHAFMPDVQAFQECNIIGGAQQTAGSKVLASTRTVAATASASRSVCPPNTGADAGTK